MAVFKDFNRVGVTTVIASHDDALMAEYATRAFKIEPGKFADSAGQRAPTYNITGEKRPDHNKSDTRASEKRR